jgi:hypothetical protein
MFNLGRRCASELNIRNAGPHEIGPRIRERLRELRETGTHSCVCDEVAAGPATVQAALACREGFTAVDGP